MKVTLRLLEEKDAETSYLWRQNPDIWKYTGSRPSQIVTFEIEKEWIKTVLKRENEIRFAICIGEENEYVGNVQLTNITSEDAEFHIFLGKPECHGKGIGTQATLLILEYALVELKLKEIYLFVNKKNTGAIKSYYKSGFYEIKTTDEEFKLIKKL